MASRDPIYIDSSWLLAALLKEEVMPNQWLSSQLITSEITEVECRRTIDRVRLQSKLSNEHAAILISDFEKTYGAYLQVHLSPAVLTRAKGAFPTVVRSLDAIHLASAELAQVKLFHTRDKQLAVAARAMGFDVG